MSIHRLSNKRGFSLIELISVLAILAVTLLIGVPALGSAVDKQRLRSATVELISAVKLARQEAINRNTTITICPSNNGLSCTANNWTSGWLVFIDHPTANRANNIEPYRLLLVKQIENANLEIIANNNLQDSITYKASGRNVQAGTITLTTRSNLQANVILNILGRPRVTFTDS